VLRAVSTPPLVTLLNESLHGLLTTRVRHKIERWASCTHTHTHTHTRSHANSIFVQTPTSVPCCLTISDGVVTTQVFPCAGTGDHRGCARAQAFFNVPLAGCCCCGIAEGLTCFTWPLSARAKQHGGAPGQHTAKVPRAGCSTCRDTRALPLQAVHANLRDELFKNLLHAGWQAQAPCSSLHSA
jgi:hypothetical protein